MRKRPFAVACALTVLAACGGEGAASARDEAAPPGLALLFPPGTEGIDEAGKRFILSSIEEAIVVDSAGTGWVDTVCGQPAGARADILDLNGDGTPEVRLTYGNGCLSGYTGSSILLFIRRDGAWVANLGFPAAVAEPLETSNLGWPDLLIGGPGFCFPVWRWNGSEYDYDHDEPQEPGGCSPG